MRSAKPLVVLATVDPLLRDSVAFGTVLDRPRTVVLRHDIVDDEDGGSIRRLIADASGVVEDVVVPLEHACLSCSVREDAIPTLARLAKDGRWDAIMLALPVSAESLPVTRALAAETRRGGLLPTLRLASVVAALDLSTAVDDLLGDDLLDERGLALTSDDRRSVGEALAAQLTHADVVLTTGEPGDDLIASDLVDHLRGAGGRRLDGLYTSDLASLWSAVHDVTVAEERLDPLLVRLPEVTESPSGVWSMELRSALPLHPERFVRDVARLGEGRLRSVGHFWVPSRPDSVCIWDGAGGQLSIGAMGRWGRRAQQTLLVFTGVDDVRDELRAAFADVLMTEAEFAAGFHPWLGRADVLEPWLGDRSMA